MPRSKKISRKSRLSKKLKYSKKGGVRGPRQRFADFRKGKETNLETKIKNIVSKKLKKIIKTQGELEKKLSLLDKRLVNLENSTNYAELDIGKGQSEFVKPSNGVIYSKVNPSSRGSARTSASASTSEGLYEQMSYNPPISKTLTSRYRVGSSL